MDERAEIAKVELLLEKSRAQRYREPQEMVRHAEAARDAAEALTGQSAALIADLRARVFAELANAYRVSDRLSVSEAAMERAFGYFEQGSKDGALLALLADRLSSLLCHRRRFTESLHLLDTLFEFYRASGEGHLAGRILVMRGLYTQYGGDPERAVWLTVGALELIDPQKDPTLVLAAVHNLLWCATEIGYFGLIQRLLPSVRPLYGSDRLNLLRLRWIEARVAAGLGHDEAEAVLRQVRDGFAEEELIFPASLVSLDLALLLLRQERIGEIVELAGELLLNFKTLRVGREAILALTLMRRAAEEAHTSEARLKKSILKARVAIQGLEHRPG